MTLVIGSVLHDAIVITSDSRSTLAERGVVIALNDRFQKIFPIPDHPLVIAHMGENRLAERPLHAFLAPFLQRLEPGNHTILEIADQLRAFAHPFIRSRLRSLGDLPNGCNFWVAGFGAGPEEPRLVELFWQRRHDTLTTEEHEYAPLSIVTGGDGQKQITMPSWRAVEHKPIAEVRALHADLMHTALTAPVTPNTVGGRPHEVVITREGWEWTQPPGRPTTRPTSQPSIRTS